MPWPSAAGLDIFASLGYRGTLFVRLLLVVLGRVQKRQLERVRHFTPSMRRFDLLPRGLSGHSELTYRGLEPCDAGSTPGIQANS